MAIQATITTIQGITLPTAYINIADTQITKAKAENGNTYNLGFNACVYAGQGAYDAGFPPVEGFGLTCELSLDGNVLTQAYTALKENPRLTDIQDIPSEVPLETEV